MARRWRQRSLTKRLWKSDRRSRSGSFSGEAFAGSVPRSNAQRRGSRNPGHGRRRLDVVVMRNGCAGGTGIELDLSLVPAKRTECSAYEMLLSESTGAHVDSGPCRSRARSDGHFRKWTSMPLSSCVRDSGRMQGSQWRNRCRHSVSALTR